MSVELLFNVMSGEGEVIVLLHGLFGSSDNLSRIAKELEKSHKVVSIDLRNHGKSFHHVSMNYDEMSEDVIRVMEYHGINKAHFIGHSMGGKVAMHIALTHPEYIDKLIIADIAPVNYPPHHQAILRGLNALPLEKVGNRKEADQYLAEYIKEPGVRQFLLKSLSIVPSEKTKWKFNLSAILNNYDSILSGETLKTSFSGRTLFIAGGLSDYIKPEYKSHTMNLFPLAKLKIIPETSHWLHAEKPKVFIAICQRFLEER